MQTSLSRELGRKGKENSSKRGRGRSKGSRSINHSHKTHSSKGIAAQLTSSLGKKVREYRRLEEDHRRESDSLSNASDRERHRLVKMQSI